MIVSKFGESVTANAEVLRKAIKIIKLNSNRHYLIASAPGTASNCMGITDMLFMCHSSFINKENYCELLNKISDRYKEIIGRHVNRDIEADKTLFWEDLVK